jgi:hypothetical protein
VARQAIVNEFHPTDEQNCVIKSPPSAKTLVLAGAGTGKTETLVHRLECLLEDPMMQHGNILVLAFSRAAVRELRKRLRQRENEARFVKARTFDSFGTLLLMNCPEAGDLAGKNYDQRIALASDFILNDVDARQRLSEVKYLIVDEMQDLVGVRQEMVRSLIQTLRHSIGFTLFSDPAQSIYEYQAKTKPSSMGAQQMLDWLRNEFKNDLTEQRFTKDFRFETEEARTALWAREHLLAAHPAYEQIRDRLRTDLRRLNSFTLDQRAPGLRRNDSPVAILCRSNAHALLLSREMFELKLPHVVQRDQTERCMPAWLANLFRGLESPELTRPEFLDLFARIQPHTHVGDPGDAWSILKRIDRSKGKEIHLVRLNEGIRSGNIPDELVQATVSKIVLSTIHRSKGLEFPNVMISDPVDAGDGPDDSDIAEEARILYVAMTRAKRSLERLNGPNGCRAGKDKNDRCRLYTYRNGFALVNSIEIRGGDCQALDPAGAFGFDGDVAAIQAYLQNSVRAGDPVELTSVDVMDAEHVQRKHYVVQHAGNYIGITSIDAFHQMQVALWPPKAFGKFELRWPSRIGGLHVETVDTVAGSPATSRKHGLGISGLWLRVRVSGLGTLHFESEYQRQKRG